MKKPIKIILLALAGITLICVIAAVIMGKAVLDDTLFYMDSRLGYVYAISFRWVCLASGILVLFWAFIAVRKRKAILSRLSSFKPKQKEKPLPTAPPAQSDTPSFSCNKCGRQFAGEKNFCPFCGEPVTKSGEGGTQ